MRADFTGHPVVAEPRVGAAEVQAFRTAEGLGTAPVLLVLPGSRRGEVGRLMPVFGQALLQVIAARPDLRIVLPAAAGVAGAVLAAAAGWPGQPLILDPRDRPRAEAEARKHAAFAAADLALAASGTVSLELAAAATPMVIAYDMSWLSWQIMSRMARLDTVTLVNIVVGQNLVPEFLGPACRPGPIATALLRLIDDPAARAAQIEAMTATMLALGQGGEAPGLRAARAVLDGLGDGHKPGVLTGS
jgi:lipid-A-disaccharide synthase